MPPVKGQNTRGLVKELVKALQDDYVILALGEIFNKRVKDIINKVNEHGAEIKELRSENTSQHESPGTEGQKLMLWKPTTIRITDL